MAKPEWGLKRNCPSCGARFYDMGHSPILCPKCGAVVEPEPAFKTSRRSAPAAASEPKAAVPVAVDEETPAGLEDEDVEIEDSDDDSASEDGDEDEGDMIEDASDLGEDDDDMAEVMEHLDDNMEDEV